MLAAIMASSDDFITSEAPDGTVLSWNPAAERIFGYTAEEMIGHSSKRLFPGSRTDEMRDILNRVVGGDRIDHYET
ncbi:MAG: PAS domain S-box protein, partial [Gemmatimonadaceae bacterium]